MTGHPVALSNTNIHTAAIRLKTESQTQPLKVPYYDLAFFAKSQALQHMFYLACENDTNFPIDLFSYTQLHLFWQAVLTS